jgi:hypothetical protein
VNEKKACGQQEKNVATVVTKEVYLGKTIVFFLGCVCRVCCMREKSEIKRV